MRFSSLPDGSPDGRLHLVSRDNKTATPARAAHSLQAALDQWQNREAELQAEYAALNNGTSAAIIPFDDTAALAALPRAWQWLDASTFASHGALLKQVYNFEAVHELGLPLMYQGISDRFMSPTEPAPFPDERDDIDFEGEFGVIIDAVPYGASAQTCRGHIRLLVQINDWSLRRLGPIEMKTGFGVIQSKPRCSMAPVAVTPDEIGAHWRDCRIDLPLHVDYNKRKFGAASGYQMAVGFDDLITHAAYSRDLVAGTVIGSGTVSNNEYRTVGSSCITERRTIEIGDSGQPQTSYMRFGDTVRMEARGPGDTPLFGTIDQQVVRSAIGTAGG